MSRLSGAGEYKIHEIKDIYFDEYTAELNRKNNIEISSQRATIISKFDRPHSNRSKFYVARFGVRVPYDGKFRGMGSIKLFKEKDDKGNFYLNAVSMGSGRFIKSVPLLIEAPANIKHVYTFCGSVN